MLNIPKSGLKYTVFYNYFIKNGFGCSFFALLYLLLAKIETDTPRGLVI